MLDTTRWWYKRGVSGFRLDAVDTLFEDPELHDNPVLPGVNAQGDPNMEDKYDKNLPEVHEELQKLRTVADESDAVLIGETWTANVAELDRYYGQNGNELQLPMDFLFTTVNKLSPPEFRRQIAAVDGVHGWPVFLIGNHDIVRSYNRFGDGKNNDAIAKLMGAFYLTLRGTPIMYYGEEIGMENNDPTRKEDVKDPIGRTGWPKEKGRDGERTPMQWNTAPNAGFSKKSPWLPVPPSYRTHNVATRIERPQLGSESLQESSRAAPHQPSLTRRQLHRSQRRRPQRDVLSAQLQRESRAGSAEHVGFPAKSNLQPFATGIWRRHSETPDRVARDIGKRQ
jgi:alpha-glucosidase